jgi:hypothetical protein
LRKPIASHYDETENFMILKTQKELETIREELHEMEKTIVEGKLIEDISKEVDLRAEELLKRDDAFTPVFRTALVINWPEASMTKRYKRFKVEFPEIDCLHRLHEVIEKTSALEFCDKYLDIKANTINPEKNPKYSLLRTLTIGFLEYQQQVAANTEIDALRTWATNVNLCDLRNDPIGSRRGVGPGVVENIRLNLGYPVIKPDRHVIGVMRQVLNLDMSPEDYVQLAEKLGVRPHYLDSVLFRYGKAMGISG